ncbi:M24 family metallopeptidase [Limosilactobacillus fastidiosus]|uniref:Aminopeptidase P family protein n=1 Tax=Limosilactobacillus fastidiosus TaxID=2759855 RepID=A0A7W3U0L0_9LACO|nr:Xaa-Pro peptidase family protein [Limosilactobacillus fastidiosus]MBB1063735.1 aminopeptidase P family protein [Limosilactobacillus fastidiosus]MBB1086736.1 aminopeptidase P family protein [Limosilactobacillus fastidiosus]MCD7084310.1 Xaa-Pro peptidase family protein [Limosilactobacillus fastidiosus]MCD7085537.1 Xaa-Pro peptidase family protein [Limosilactobacillus fastidiosus]MCD7114768.1 Xaa-Pro peptidase family protein [Limosilactobacillus fastidiosus]
MTRISRLQKKFNRLAIDAFLVTDSKNIYYLTGFSLLQGDGCLLITPQNAIIITDDRYQLALEEFESDEVVATISRDYYGSVNKICEGLNLTVLGFEDSISYQLFDVFDELMSCDIVPFHYLIERMRLIKDSTEITKLRAAAELQSAGFEYILSVVHPGVSERELAIKLDYWMKMHGASAASFPTIVASGANSAKPHATASDKLIVDGDVVTLDFGYYLDGYTADMTRTFAVGSIDPELRDVYRIVNEARKLVIEKVKVGIHGDELDFAGRSLIEEAGYGDEFNHGMGHGIGLTVHELPTTYAPGATNVTLKNNEVITVEPGIYIPEIGGIRIEDDIVVTHGGAEVITTAPTELIIVKD